MSNFCKHCGAPVNPAAKFCAKCGKAVEESADVPVQPVQPAPPVQQPQNQSYQQPYQQAQPPYQSAYGGQPGAKRENNQLVIALLVAVVLLLGGGIGYYMYSNTAGSDASTYSKVDKKTNDANTKTPAKDDAAATSAPAASGSDLTDFVREKDEIDTAIGEMANRINAHLTNHAGFQGYNGIKNDARAVVDRASNAKDRLNGTSAADPNKKQALLNLLSLEVDRAQGLYKGIVDSQNGGDYSYGFQNGTKASYSFDSATSSFNANYK